jgi:hypothetical protein
MRRPLRRVSEAMLASLCLQPRSVLHDSWQMHHAGCPTSAITGKWQGIDATFDRLGVASPRAEGPNT